MTPERSPSVHEITRVDVTRIHHYSRNPRRQQNPEYDRIKASIQAEGLDQPLVLSQEPGAADYVLHSGGNTRLRILKELLEETGDERFRWIDCVVKPWSQESNVLFAHLRENELRGGLPFIDKALAVFEAKSLLECEMGVESLSQRQLEELFRERGFGLSHSMISKMGYAVETLWPLMPKALAAGLGRPQVEKIRAIERAARAIWDRRQLGGDTVFDAVFSELCRRHDGAEWDIQPLRDALENEISVESELNRQVIHLEMEAQLSGRAFSLPDPSETETELDDCCEAEPQEHSVNELSSPTVILETVPADAESPVRDLDKHVGQSNTEIEGTSAAAPLKGGQQRNLEVLRSQLWDCAVTLATSHGLHETVIHLPDQGLGFLLIDVPSPELRESLDQDMLDLVSALWWQLAASSELTVAPTDIVLTYLDEESPLYQALASHDAGLLFGSVWTPDPGHLNSQLWQQLNPPDWQHLLQMMESYRSIKRLAFDTGVELWAQQGGESDVVQ
jgi:ParB family protein of integrating conjugative element (PFGI_1 class)